MSKKESKFKKEFKEEVMLRWPEAEIFDIDPFNNWSHPDMIIVCGPHWVALDTKRARDSSHRPNQDYFIDRLDAMSYAAFLNPTNKEEVLDGMEHIFSH